MKKIILFFPLILIILLQSINSFAFPGDFRFLTSARETYDDNVTANEDKEDDFITNIMLGIGYTLESSTQNLDFLSHINQQLYIEHTDFNNNSQDIAFIYSKEFSELSDFTLSDTFGHYPEAQDFQSMFGQPMGRNGYYSNNLAIAYNIMFSRALLGNIHYSNTITHRTNGESGDSMQNGAGFSFGHYLNSTNVVSVFYDYNNVIFTENAGNDDNKKYHIHNTGLGYQLYFTEQSYLQGNGGIELLQNTENNEYRPFFSASIIDNIDENNNLNITFTSRYVVVSSTNSINKSYTASTEYKREFPSLSFSLSLFYGYGKTIAESNVVNQTAGARTSISYFLSENLSLSAGYTYTYAKAEIELAQNDTTDNQYSRNQFFIAINAQF